MTTAIYALALHPGALPFGEAAVVLSQTIWIGGLFLFGVLLPLTFPTGHLMSRRWLIPVAFAVAYFIVVTAGNAFIPGSTIAGYPKITNPIGIKGQGDLFNNLQTLSVIPAVIWILGVVASIVVRFRRSRGIEREQMKWFLFSFLLVPVALALNNVPVLDRLSFLIAVPAVAVSIAVAVLRYRLYDIDVVISRTLVYATLALSITCGVHRDRRRRRRRNRRWGQAESWPLHPGDRYRGGWLSTCSTMAAESRQPARLRHAGDTVRGAVPVLRTRRRVVCQRRGAAPHGPGAGRRDRC